jgi:hypothetical protein
LAVCSVLASLKGEIKMTKFIVAYNGVQIGIEANNYAAAKRFGAHIFRLNKAQALALIITKGEL